mgnify:CR=1 FL=1
MTEKNQQEKMAAERQVELFTKAFGKAKEDKWHLAGQQRSQGSWTLPEAFAGISLQCHHLGMHAAQNGLQDQPIYAFSEAKKRGESVQSKEKGVPFLWYNWNEYVNKHNPEAKSAVQTTRLSLQTSKQTTKVSEAVK